jgi:hypothetical protein
VGAIVAATPGTTTFDLLDAVLRAIIQAVDPDKRVWYGRRQAVIDHSPNYVSVHCSNGRPSARRSPRPYASRA